MNRIAITAEAFEAIASTLPLGLGSVGFENATQRLAPRLGRGGRLGLRPRWREA